MSTLHTLLRQCQLPALVPVIRRYTDDGIKDIAKAVHDTMDSSGIAARLPKGASVAVGVGSRGLARLPELVAATISWFKAQGAAPFIIPTMGSHGGATAEGQIGVLEKLGVTEESAGAPIKATMDVVQLGQLEDGFPVYMDAYAAEADRIFFIARVKPHTGFSGKHESGLIKMITIGFGKQRGADSCHTLGFGHFNRLVPAMAGVCLEAKPGILGGLATVENAYDEPCVVRAVPRERLLEEDAELIIYARSRMPSIPAKDIDVLIVDHIGKNISGSGMDPNITGKHASQYTSGGPNTSRIVALDLYDASYGNASGVGAGDVISKRLFDKIDFDAMYTNSMTSTLLSGVLIPVIMPTDEMAVRYGIKTCNAGSRPLKVVRIKDTLTMDRLLLSPALLDGAAKTGDCSVAGDEIPFSFDADGMLTNFDIWDHFPGL
ncbi:conserved hypothetical protein [uncultured delta proteobacterium]|uniref:Uncharacterized protein n=1 Tax=uncultured delta proteobacterium TaxID=34034 RepID=A0A212KA04_9DELT|nr:conserved hypothetical protein [uncultured delta proteobacterium]